MGSCTSAVDIKSTEINLKRNVQKCANLSTSKRVLTNLSGSPNSKPSKLEKLDYLPPKILQDQARSKDTSATLAVPGCNNHVEIEESSEFKEELFFEYNYEGILKRVPLLNPPQSSSLMNRRHQQKHSNKSTSTSTGSNQTPCFTPTSNQQHLGGFRARFQSN